MKTLLLLSLSGSAMALLLLALRYLLFRKMPSTVYYYAWILVLLRFALPLPGLIPERGAAPPEPAAYESAILREPEPDDGLPLSSEVFEQAPGSEAAPVAPAAAEDPAAGEDAAPAADVSAAPPAPARRAPRIRWKDPALWLGVWALGAILCLAVPLVAYARFRCALRETLRTPDEALLARYEALPGRKCALYLSSAVKTPLTLGLLRPMIVLPAGLGGGETLSNVLRHELTHVRRRDALYKWLALAVFSAHWFNPLVWFLRPELDRACELSCDEALLASMTREERRSYGGTLLQMAASGALPAGVVATTFATEKKNLKERLEQIMTYKRSFSRVLAALLALALLAGCGAAAGPAVQTEAPAPVQEAETAETAEPTEPAEAPVSAEPAVKSGEVRVSNVDELLDAIAPNTVIVLAPGDYDFSAAANYGVKPKGARYDWDKLIGTAEKEGQYELIISYVDNLTIRGEDSETTRILIQPRFANVILFDGCRNLTVEGLTAGHTDGGVCMGGVLRFEHCKNVAVRDCGLFGCGTVGVDGYECEGLSLTGSRIYECSSAAVTVDKCKRVRVEDCEIYDHGGLYQGSTAVSLLQAGNTDGFVIYNNRIYGNDAQYLLNCSYTRNAFFLSNEVSGNAFGSGAFCFRQYPCVVDGCAFTDNEQFFWVIDHTLDPVDPDGQPLDGEALAAMTLHDCDPDMPFPTVALNAAAEVEAGGTVTVSTIDEFLKAIGPDRTILLDGALFDLAGAQNYGKAGTEYYSWQESYDGPKLVIQNVSGLSILSASDDPAATVISATPRYADVLTFRKCSDIVLGGFTAGHTKEPGACAGGVLYFDDCHGVQVGNCRLFGCGILGVQSAGCTDLHFDQTEIYECSQGAGQFYRTDGVVFLDCDIHDVPSPHFRFTECGDIEWNGEAVSQTSFDVDENNTAAAPTLSFRDFTNSIFTGPSLSETKNAFANEPAKPLQALSPMALFLAQVQQTISDKDWESLADQIDFPCTLFIDDFSFGITSREEFISYLSNEEFMALTFTEDWSQMIADAKLDECGMCAHGNTALDHHIAFAVVKNSGQTAEPTVEDFKITAISFAGPFWPGRVS